MNIDSSKVELIKWIEQLNDSYSIRRLLRLKKSISSKNESLDKKFGSGKHLIEYVADDFNEPIDLFEDYER